MDAGGRARSPRRKPSTMTGRLFVIGASAGGVQALRTLAAGLPPDFPSALLVVLHVGAHPSILPEVLAWAGPVPVSHAVDGEIVRPGHIHIAPPDRHMLLEGDKLRLTRGPKEHHARPAIDPLFLSAALERGPDVVGIVLTGMLDDGTAGLQAIKHCGGLAVVQDPADALYPSMPQSALQHVDIDHRVTMKELPALLMSLASVPAPTNVPRPAQALKHELALTLEPGHAMDHLPAIGSPSTYACPDCHGDLWALNGASPPRFRCHTGHAFTLRSLLHCLSTGADDAVWNALRALQEKSLALHHLSRICLEAADLAEAAKLKSAAAEAEDQTRLLRDMLEKTSSPLE